MSDNQPKPTTTIGVLFTQLGTPDAPTPAAVRRYLKEFLSDRRVVDLNPWLWQPLLRGVILPRRSPRSAALYQKIWRDDGVSPLLHHTRALTRAVGERLGAGVLTRFAMRYGNPSLKTVIREMMASGVEKLLIFPLYPQFSAATTATTLDGIQAALADSRHIPTLRFSPPFHDDPGYIAALAGTVPEKRKTDNKRFFLFSFHGLPQRHVDEGDPYADHCQSTAQRLAEALKLPKERWRLTYQSRFGREKWLLPATDDVLSALPGEGIEHLTLLCPGFVADCLETLEEIAIQGRNQFLSAGGKEADYLPCLNGDTAWIEALTAMTRRELAGWLPG